MRLRLTISRSDERIVMKNVFIDYENASDRIELSDIEFGLRHLPGLIARQAEMIAGLRKELDIARLNLKVAESKRIVAESSEDMTATDKKALAVLATQVEQMAIIEASCKVELASIKLDMLENKFISVRKQAAIVLKEQEASNNEWVRSRGKNGAA